MEPEIENATDVLVTLGAAAAGVLAAFLLGTVLSAVVRRIGRRSDLARDLSRRLRRPDRAVLMVLAVWIAVRLTTDASTTWLPVVEHLLLIALIGVGAWWVGAVAFVLEDSALQRYRVDTADNRHARRVRTQITVVRRLTVALIVVCAIAAVLLTFPEAHRTMDGKLRPFKRGVFTIARDAGLPIVPLAVRGAYGMLPKGAITCRPAKVEVYMAPPIETAGLTDAQLTELMDRVRQVIEAWVERGEKLGDLCLQPFAQPDGSTETAAE